MYNICTCLQRNYGARFKRPSIINRSPWEACLLSQAKLCSESGIHFSEANTTWSYSCRRRPLLKEKEYGKHELRRWSDQVIETSPTKWESKLTTTSYALIMSVPVYRRGLPAITFCFTGHLIAFLTMWFSGKMGQELTRGFTSPNPASWSQLGLMGPGIMNNGAAKMYPSQPLGSWKCIKNTAIAPMDSPHKKAGRPLFSSLSRTDL